MTYDSLCSGNSLICQMTDTRNEIMKLEQWIAELKVDATVLISSNEKPEHSIVVLHGTEVLHLVEQRLGELKERLEKLKSEFDAL